MSVNENDSLQKNVLITKLEAISVLYKKALSIKRKMYDFVPEDNYERKVVVPIFPGEYEDDEDRENLKSAVDHESKDAIEQMTKEYDRHYCPQEPRRPNFESEPSRDTPLTNEYKKKKGCFPIVAAFIAVCSLISGGLFFADTLTMIINIAIIAACVIVVLIFLKKMKKLKDADEEAIRLSIESYERRKEEIEQKYKNDMEEYRSLMISHKLLRAGFIDEYSEWLKIYLESLKEEAEIREKLEADRASAVKKIEDEEFTPVLQDLAELNDLITTEYLPAIDDIIDLLKSGRADDLKEAINLYEDILYRERQLQLKREQEEQRRYEEELRRQEEKRRYQEEKEFRRQQEWDRKMESERLEREAERRHREEMQAHEDAELRHKREERERLRKEDLKAAQARRDQERREHYATMRQCQNCVHVANCSVKFDRPNCASYRPR